jgi:Saxitoxin biosynthesis operon protein SxtJ
VVPKDHHEFRHQGAPVDGSSDRAFGFVVAGFFVILAAQNAWRSGKAWPFYLVIAVPLLVIAMWHPEWLTSLNRMWTKLGLLLSKVVNPVVMGAVFYLVITPVAVFMRLRGRDLLSRRRDRTAHSYWILRDQSVPQSMKNQF